MSGVLLSAANEDAHGSRVPMDVSNASDGVVTILDAIDGSGFDALDGSESASRRPSASAGGSRSIHDAARVAIAMDVAKGMPEDVAILAAWLRDQGGFLHPCLGIVSCGLGGGGRCAQALCDVTAGDLLLHVPQQAQITTDQSLEFDLELDESESESVGQNLTLSQEGSGCNVASVLPGLARKLGSAHPGLDIESGASILTVNGKRGSFVQLVEEFEQVNHLRLSTFKDSSLRECIRSGTEASAGIAEGETIALSLRLIQEQQLGNKSRFTPYLQLIQDDFHPLLWDEDVQRECLEGTPAESGIGERMAMQRADLEVLAGCGVGSPNVNSSGLDPEHDVMLRWARNVVRSRSYGYSTPSTDGSNSIALVPFGDLFTDAVQPNSQWARSREGGVFEIKASRVIAQGDEITMSYGSKPNWNLLLQYHFIHPENPHDQVEVDLLAPLDGESNEQYRSDHNEAYLTLSLGGAHLLKFPKAMQAHRQALNATPAMRFRLSMLSSASAAAVELEAASLNGILDHCSAAAERWATSPPPKCSEACAMYRSGLATLGRGCAEFAALALAELGRSAVNEVPRSSGIVESAASRLASNMFIFWFKDAALERLGDVLANRCVDEPPRELLNTDSIIVMLSNEADAQAVKRSGQLVLSPSPATGYAFRLSLHFLRGVLQKSKKASVYFALQVSQWSSEVSLEALALHTVIHRCKATGAYVHFFVHLANLANACVAFAAQAIRALGLEHHDDIEDSLTPEARRFADMWFAVWWYDAMPRLPDALGDMSLDDKHWFLRAGHTSEPLVIDLNTDERTPPNCSPRFMLELSHSDAFLMSLAATLQVHREALLASAGVKLRFRLAMAGALAADMDTAKASMAALLEVEALLVVYNRCSAAASYFRSAGANFQRLDKLATACASFSGRALAKFGHVNSVSLVTSPLAEKWFAVWEADAAMRMSILFKNICVPEENTSEVFLDVPVPIHLSLGNPKAELWLSQSEQASWALPFTLQHLREALGTIKVLAVHIAISPQTLVEVEVMVMQMVMQSCAAAWIRFMVLNDLLAALARGCVIFAHQAIMELGHGSRLHSAFAAQLESEDLSALANEVAQDWLAAWWEDAGPRLPTLAGRCIEAHEPLSE